MSTEIETGPDDPGVAADVKGPPKERTATARERENEWSSQRHIYEPHRVGLPPLLPYLREVWRRREFALELSRTSLRAQHYDTAFGQLWLVLNPLLLSLVYFFLVDILRGGHRAPGFLAHLTAGIFVYYFVSGAIRDGVKSVVSGGKLVLNTAFPRVLLPLSSVLVALMRFVPTFIVYIPIHLASGLPVGPQLLWLLPMFAMFTLVCAGVTMFVAALQVYFRDVRNFLPYLLRLWLYASPILYFAEKVPHSYRPILKINPIGSLLTGWSDVLHDGVAPSAGDMLIGLAWGVALFIVGALFFISRERDFAVRL